MMTFLQLCHEIEEMDVTEPGCMDKISLYLLHLHGEDEEFMELLLQKVGDATITWERPWYQMSQCLTRPLPGPNEEETETFRTDSMDKKEVKRVRKNWHKFRKEYDVPNKLICLARWKNKKTKNHRTPEEHVRRFVTAYLAQGLQRNLYQVHRHIVSCYGGAVRGDYSPIEQKIMEICFHHKPWDAIPLLSMVLSREPRGIYRKLGYALNGKPKYDRMKWTLPLATILLKSLMEYTELSLEELKNKRFDTSVWIQIESKIPQQFAYLQAFWYNYLHVQLFVKLYVSVKALRKAIYKKLAASHYRVWSDIRWKEIVKEFPDGFTHSFLHRAARGGIHRCPNYLKLPLRDVIEYGLQNINESKKNCLKNLILNQHGELEVIKYTESLET